MKENIKDLDYWKENAQDAYELTPICVLRYISELEKKVYMKKEEFKEAKQVPDFSNEALRKRIDFLTVEIKCDKAKAIERYDEEYQENINGVKDCNMSFSQWLVEREIEALRFNISIY